MLANFIRRIREEPDLAVKFFGKWSTAAEDVVQEDFNSWNALWQKLHDVATAPWRSSECAVTEAPMERIAGNALRKSARSFKAKTAIGVDAISPCHYSWLSDELLGRVAELLMKLEVVGIWLARIAEAIVHLIPKATGGRRPVGLLPSLVRVWERVRKPAVEG